MHPRVPLNALVDRGDAVEMPDGVLGHAPVPAVDLREDRCGIEPDDRLELPAQRGDEVLVGERHELLVVSAADERPDKYVVIGGAMRPLDRAPRRRVDPPALDLRDDEAEPGETGLNLIFPEGERHVPR